MRHGKQSGRHFLIRKMVKNPIHEHPIKGNFQPVRVLGTQHLELSVMPPLCRLNVRFRNVNAHIVIGLKTLGQFPRTTSDIKNAQSRAILKGRKQDGAHPVCIE